MLGLAVENPEIYQLNNVLFLGYINFIEYIKFKAEDDIISLTL